MNFEVICIITTVIVTVLMTIHVQQNKHKSWVANDPLVGISVACMQIGAILLVVLYVSQCF